MTKYKSPSRLVLILSFLTLQGTTFANVRGPICPGELASYRQCVLDNPLKCFPSCNHVDVRVRPEDLTYMMDPALRCNPMKLASCAMRDCCKPCAAEEAIYWSCVEKESGCGTIDCEAILNPIRNNGGTSTEPQNEEKPQVAEEVTNPSTGGSDGQNVPPVTDTSSGVAQPTQNGCTNCQQSSSSNAMKPTLGGSDVQNEDVPPTQDDNAYGTLPSEDNTNPATNQDSASGTDSTDPVDSNSRVPTCFGELGIYKKCVLENSSKCSASCTGVDVFIKSEDLANMLDPSLECDPMKQASCAMRSCCEQCGFEEALYWFCIESETGCGAIDCRDSSSPTSNKGDTSSEPQNNEEKPTVADEVTKPITGGSDGQNLPPVTDTANGDAPLSQNGCVKCQQHSQDNAAKPDTGVSDEQNDPPVTNTGAGYEPPVENDSANDQPPLQNNNGNGNSPSIDNTNSATNQDGASGTENTNTAPVSSTPRGPTCPGELAIYKQCVLDNPLKCFPSCNHVDVKVRPEDLTYMMDPALRCKPMKLASCAMRNCCKPCAAEEATYWSCIEREAGCGTIDCEAILNPTGNKGGTSTEPQNEEKPPVGDEATTPITGGSDGQNVPPVTGSANEDVPPVTDSAYEDEPPLENDSANGEPQNDNANGNSPSVDNTSPATNQDSTSGTENTNTAPVGSNSRGPTCPGELATYQQCVLDNPLKCFPSCTHVDVKVKPADLTYMMDPSLRCNPMKLASCAMRDCCKPCAAEEATYWRCIEREAGCGAIDCQAILNPRSTTTNAITDNSYEVADESQVTEDGTQAFDAEVDTISGAWDNRIATWFAAPVFLLACLII